MKKLWFLIPIVLVLVGGIVALVFGGIHLLKNIEKEPITARVFTNVMEDRGYTVENSDDNPLDVADIENYRVAEKGDRAVSFLVFETNKGAELFYNLMKENFEVQKGSSYSTSHSEINNFSKYTLKSSGKYMVVSRIENTVVLIDTEDDNKDHMEEILKELGY